MFALESTSNYCSIRFAAMVAGPQKTFAILIISFAGMEVTVSICSCYDIVRVRLSVKLL